MSLYFLQTAILSISTRYRDIPTFGRDTIRKFSRNTSEMKKLAARDWEDILQVRNIHSPNLLEDSLHN